MLDLDFKMHKTDREEVVSMVKGGKLKYNVPDSPSLIQLPKPYDHLSKGGGEVIAVKTGDSFTILFFTYRGMLDNFSGFVYTPNDKQTFVVDKVQMDDNIFLYMNDTLGWIPTKNPGRKGLSDEEGLFVVYVENFISVHKQVQK